MKTDLKPRIAAGTDGSDPVVPGIHAWLVLWKASHAVQAIANQDIKKLGLCTSDFGVLEALLHKGPQPVNEIGKRVLLTSGSMTAAINRLQRKGLVTRKEDPADHRAWMVHLTAAGRRWIESAFVAHARHMEEPFAPLNGEERDLLITLLKKLGKNAAAARDSKKPAS
jgi:MarR family transcriptional regulator, 2-MHQ and catechol-resistance regulon repressor